MTTEALRAAMQSLGYDSGKLGGDDGVRAFAEAIGVSWRTVYYWLSGENMSRLAVTSIHGMLERKRAG